MWNDFVFPFFQLQLTLYERKAEQDTRHNKVNTKLNKKRNLTCAAGQKETAGLHIMTGLKSFSQAERQKIPARRVKRGCRYISIYWV
jgi:hypothetical protein